MQNIKLEKKIPYFCNSWNKPKVLILFGPEAIAVIQQNTHHCTKENISASLVTTDRFPTPLANWHKNRIWEPFTWQVVAMLANVGLGILSFCLSFSLLLSFFLQLYIPKPRVPRCPPPSGNCSSTCHTRISGSLCPTDHSVIGLWYFLFNFHVVANSGPLLLENTKSENKCAGSWKRKTFCLKIFNRHYSIHSCNICP